MKKMITIICTIFAIPIVSLIMFMVVSKNIDQYFMYYTVQKYGKTDYYNVLNNDLRNTATNSRAETDKFELKRLHTRHPNKILIYKVPTQENLRGIERISPSFDTSYSEGGSVINFYDKKTAQDKYRFNLSPENKWCVAIFEEATISNTEKEIAYNLFKQETDNYIKEQLNYQGEPHPWLNLQWLFNLTH